MALAADHQVIVDRDAQRLGRGPSMSARDMRLLRLAYDIACRMARAEVRRRPVLGNWQVLIDYLQTAMAHEQVEQFRILFLDRKNNLIADEVQQRGTVDHTPVYPREVMKRALILNAFALIVVHNHPSGDCRRLTPSWAESFQAMKKRRRKNMRSTKRHGARA